MLAGGTKKPPLESDLDMHEDWLSLLQSNVGRR
jgi:hypothetical protein